MAGKAVADRVEVRLAAETSNNWERAKATVERPTIMRAYAAGMSDTRTWCGPPTLACEPGLQYRRYGKALHAGGRPRAARRDRRDRWFGASPCR